MDWTKARLARVSTAEGTVVRMRSGSEPADSA